MRKSCFIGLGNMGFPMAGWLSQNNYEVTVYNRTFSKTQSWNQEFQGDFAETPALAARDADFVFLCVGNDHDVLSVIQGENGAIAGMKEGAVLIDHTTTSFELAKKLSIICKEKKIDFLDAPVSGGQIGAQNAQLTIMVGGDNKVFHKAKPLMSSYAKKIALMGEVGHGQLTKMMNQICIAGLVQALSEAIFFGEKKGY